MESEKWEVVREKYFVYKRQKRKLDPTALVAAGSSSSADSEHDPRVLLKERRNRKRNALLQLKHKYKTEIALWDHLSHSLKALEQRHGPTFAEETEERDCVGGVGGEEEPVGPVLSASSLLSDVFLQVEAQEAIIRDFSQLCEVAESLCSVHEEKTKQQFIDLPIWKSPQELMASLCED